MVQLLQLLVPQSSAASVLLFCLAWPSGHAEHWNSSHIDTNNSLCIGRTVLRIASLLQALLWMTLLKSALQSLLRLLMLRKWRPHQCPDQWPMASIMALTVMASDARMTGGCPPFQMGEQVLTVMHRMAMPPLAGVGAKAGQNLFLEAPALTSNVTAPLGSLAFQGRGRPMQYSLTGLLLPATPTEMTELVKCLALAARLLRRTQLGHCQSSGTLTTPATPSWPARLLMGALQSLQRRHVQQRQSLQAKNLLSQLQSLSSPPNLLHPFLSPLPT